MGLGVINTYGGSTDTTGLGLGNSFVNSFGNSNIDIDTNTPIIDTTSTNTTLSNTDIPITSNTAIDGTYVDTDSSSGLGLSADDILKFVPVIGNAVFNIAKFNATKSILNRQLRLQEKNYKNYVEDKRKNNERSRNINRSFFARTKGDNIHDTYTRHYI